MDYAFYESTAYWAVNLEGIRVAACLVTGGADVTDEHYLATFTFPAETINGPAYTLGLRADEIRLRDSLGRPVEFVAPDPLEVSEIGGGEPRTESLVEV